MATDESSNTHTKLLIFGLARDTTEQEVRSLLGNCRRQLRAMGEQVRIDMLDVPGNNESTFAVVHLWRDPVMAWEISAQINARRLHGRPLQAIVPSMAW
jgi:hypothetical protein